MPKSRVALYIHWDNQGMLVSTGDSLTIDAHNLGVMGAEADNVTFSSASKPSALN